MPIKALIKKLESLTPDSILREILNDDRMKEFVIELNTEGQSTSQLFEQGVNSEGRSLKDVGGNRFTDSGYSPFTIEEKKKRGQRVDHITLKDTGDFYGSFVVKGGVDFIEITADGQKADTTLFEEWGVDIVGLTEENLNILTNAIAEKIQEVVETRLAA
jgi:hypothetical protein